MDEVAGDDELVQLVHYQPRNNFLTRSRSLMSPPPSSAGTAHRSPSDGGRWSQDAHPIQESPDLEHSVPHEVNDIRGRIDSQIIVYYPITVAYSRLFYFPVMLLVCGCGDQTCCYRAGDPDGC